MKAIRLPSRENITVIDPREDPLAFYYSPLTGWVYRHRLILAASLLDGRRYARLLDIGYASGIFLPHLASVADDLHGLDIHDKPELVKRMLELEGIQASLHQGNILDLPFEDGYFDGIVCLSVLEHLTDAGRALGEIARVLRPDGVAVMGFPVRNTLTDSFYRLVGFQPRDIHPSGHRDILQAARSTMRVESVRRFPLWLPMNLGLYVLCRCRAG